MSDNGGPAFPVLHHINNLPTSADPGMSLRDYFAAAALIGQIAGKVSWSDPDVVAFNAYKYADAMLEARK